MTTNIVLVALATVATLALSAHNALASIVGENRLQLRR